MKGGMKRWLYTKLCNFIYKHPVAYQIADKLVFRKYGQEWRELAALKIPRKGRTLEIGCGRSPAIRQGIVLDLSLSMLNKMERKPERVAICASSLQMPFRNESFDSAISVFPPGIAADNGFFEQKKFWQELAGVLDKNGVCVAAVYVEYKNWFFKLISKVLDPLPPNFWENLQKIAPEFKVGVEKETDSAGNKLVLAIAKKKN